MSCHLFLSTGKVKTLGEVTPAMVRRAGNISGAIGHELVRLFAKNIGTGYLQERTDGPTKEASQQKAVRDYVQTYGGDNLVQTIPDRKLSGAENFHHTVEFKSVADSGHFHQKMLDHSKVLDFKKTIPVRK